jgi:signal transduction histidine kinase
LTTEPARDPLAVLRRRLTFWYAVTLGLILASLGFGLYTLIHNQIESQLDSSLRGAAREVMRAARIREIESKSARGAVVDAVEELRIPDRKLFLFDSAAVPIHPRTANERIVAVARRALADGAARDESHLGSEHVLSLYAERFSLASGERQVAMAGVDEVEIDDRYADLIAAFSGVAVLAVVLATIGGYFFLRQAIAPAEQSMSTMRRFMADAAHEFRTPLTVLRTKAEVMLQREHSAPEYVDTIRAMEDEFRRLGRIVDDLLLLARADAGVRPVVRAPFYLDDIALDAVHSIQALALAGAIQLEVTEFVETQIIGDAPLVRELIVILLDNAVKFTPTGGRVEVRVFADPQPTLIVEDTGIGISADAAPHVFERFFRGDVSRERGRGAGLGLSIAQWIASLHKARITLSPREQGGTVATVTFPSAGSHKPS